MKIAGYACGSSDPRDLDLQLDAIEQTATREGWQLVTMYTDMASAAEDVRAGWNQLLADASWHTFEAVVVQRVDRAARSLGELRDILDQLRSCRVAFLALDENLHTSTLASGADFPAPLGDSNGGKPATVPAPASRVRARVTRPGRPRKSVRAEDVRALRDQDLSFREIARRLRSTPGTVYRRFYEGNPSDAPAPRGEVG
jgi:DNA invertase Pin-like site-specific DNA recombinase